jgi:3-methylcrotonyl-CoA carboxylase alpha subunit
MTRRRLVRGDGANVTVTLDADGRAHIGDDAFAITSAGEAWRVIDGDGGSRLVYVARAAEGYWVHVDGAVFLLEVGEAARFDAQRRHDADDSLAAPMPATVLSIVTPAGTNVTAGDTLVLLEAMKMELPIRAPRDGIVAAVHCREGQLVQPGVALVELT